MGGAFFRIEKPLPHYTAGALQNVDHLWTVDGARRTTSEPRRLTCWLGSSLKARTVHPLKTCAVVCLPMAWAYGIVWKILPCLFFLSLTISHVHTAFNCIFVTSFRNLNFFKRKSMQGKNASLLVAHRIRYTFPAVARYIAVLK